MIVQATGDRNWTDRERIKVALLSLQSMQVNGKRGKGAGPYVLRHGNARGADALFAEVAEELNWIVIPFQAAWHKYGRAAGPIRNREMVEARPKADVCLYAHDDLDNSKGTANMIKQCEGAHIPVRRVP